MSVKKCDLIMMDYRGEVMGSLNESVIGIVVCNIKNKEDEHA